MSDPGGKDLKSAYELALERLEKKGIERPRPEALSDEQRRRMDEIRNKAESELARVEILYRDSLTRETDPVKRAEADDHYGRDRRRIEDERDRKLARLREEPSS